ncbi:MAG: FecR domain-containing protein, partial [Rhodospirillales bacterium]|nr:FecR domain-containing protein [Rhodospirillales bacterium]
MTCVGNKLRNTLFSRGRGLGLVAGFLAGLFALTGCEPASAPPSAMFVAPPSESLEAGRNLSPFENRWAVAAVDGETVFWRPRSGETQRLLVGTILGPANVLEVGTGGSATLARGNDLIVVAENTEMTVPTEPATEGFTKVIQSIGRLLLQIESGRDRRFQVDTPYLSATVKGTAFSVSVTADEAAVSVTEGTVG